MQLHKSTDHKHEPDVEAALSVKMKSDLCDNQTLPRKEVYNQYMSLYAPPPADDLLEPQPTSCKSQIYGARRQTMLPLPVNAST